MITIVVAAVSWRIAYPYLYPTYAVRYELRVEVETPQGLKSGSSVIEARYGWQPTLGGITSSVDNDLSGEAVFVDLGRGKNLVVLLTGKSSRRENRTGEGGRALNLLELPPVTFSFPSHHRSGTPAGIARAKTMGRVEVPIERLPTVVTFADINRVESVRRVDPINLEAAFGAGYRLASITIEMTEKEISTGIRERLPGLYSNKDGIENCKQLKEVLGLNVCWSDFRIVRGKL